MGLGRMCTDETNKKASIRRLEYSDTFAAKVCVKRLYETARRHRTIRSHGRS